MDKRIVLTRIHEMQMAIDGFHKFAGRAAVLKDIQNHYDFLARHQTEPKIERMLLGVCEGLHKGALKRHNALEAARIS